MIQVFNIEIKYHKNFNHEEFINTFDETIEKLNNELKQDNQDIIKVFSTLKLSEKEHSNRIIYRITVEHPHAHIDNIIRLKLNWACDQGIVEIINNTEIYYPTERKISDIIKRINCYKQVVNRNTNYCIEQDLIKELEWVLGHDDK